jgi:hypothetical protein
LKIRQQAGLRMAGGEQRQCNGEYSDESHLAPRRDRANAGQLALSYAGGAWSGNRTV